MLILPNYILRSITYTREESGSSQKTQAFKNHGCKRTKTGFPLIGLCFILSIFLYEYLYID